MSDGTTRSVGGGRYILRDLLGQGGMASVHLAHDTVLDRPVAVKTLHTELGREQSFRERFRREAQAVARLNHGNIVSVYDSGEDRTTEGTVVPYIVMEYVQGRPLRDILDEDIARQGAMRAGQALEIVAEVLAALAESHGMGLVHRDIKPGNVMVTRRGSVVKVMDFGIARAMQSGVSSMTQTGMVVGTPHYLSPEQALGRGVDERSDLYSVGCLLFELLTGRLPFEGDSPLSIAYQHVQEPPPATSRFNGAVSAAADALVARALRKNPAERFPTAEAMRDEVLRVAAAERGTGTMPMTSGVPGPAAGGSAGVSSAMFPPVAPGPAASGPTAAGPMAAGPMAPGPVAAGPVAPGPHTPPPTVPPHTPPPYGQPAGRPMPQAPYQQHQQPSRPHYQPQPQPQPQPAYGFQQHQTPPPVPPPARREGKGARRTAVVVMVSAAAVVGLLMVVIIAAVLSSSGSSDNGDTTDSDDGSSVISPTASPSATASVRSAGGDSSGVVQADPSSTVPASKCTDATKSYVHKEAVLMPDFFGKYAQSVEACMDAAGWKYKIRHQHETLFGKGAVVKQSPEMFDYFNPRKQTVTIWVSTGTAG